MCAVILDPNFQRSNFHRREMFQLLLSGLGAESIMQTMDVLLEHLRSLPVEEQASVAVLLLQLNALVCSCLHFAPLHCHKPSNLYISFATFRYYLKYCLQKTLEACFCFVFANSTTMTIEVSTEMSGRGS